MIESKAKSIVRLVRIRTRRLCGLMEGAMLAASYPLYCLTNKRLPFKTFLKLRTANWYHDFSILGVKTQQFDFNGYDTSQQDKQYILFKMLDQAISFCQSKPLDQGQIRLVELFCADCFYSIYALQNGVDSATGIDLADDSGEGSIRSTVLDQASLISGLLGKRDKLTLVRQDVREFQDEYDLCICAGGLYHLENPEQLIRHISKKIRGSLVIQTVVSLAVGSEKEYFESPAPGWTWGCRFNDTYLINLLKSNGWNIQSIERNELRANRQLCDRGSLNIFCTRA